MAYRASEPVEACEEFWLKVSSNFGTEACIHIAGSQNLSVPHVFVIPRLCCLVVAAPQDFRYLMNN